MGRAWTFKALAVALLSVLSVLVLLPTWSLATGHTLPSWISHYFTKEIQLGLDLQGGLHLVYEVEVDKAVSDKADRLSTDLEERLLKERSATAKVTREGRDDIVLRFAKPSDAVKLDKKLFDDYKRYLFELDRDNAAGVVRLRMDDRYVAELSDYAVRQGIETMRNRVDKFGIAEASILQKGQDIVVELPGLKQKDFERIKNNIGRTAQLEFKLNDDGAEYMQKVAVAASKSTTVKVRDDSWSDEAGKLHSDVYLEAKKREQLEAFFTSLSPDLKVPIDHVIGFEEVSARDDKGSQTQDKLWRTYYLGRRAELTGEYIVEAEVSYDQQGVPQVAIEFDREGATLFEKVTGSGIGKKMAILLDDRVTSAPVIKTRIAGGRAVIEMGGGLRDPLQVQQEAKDLVAVLRTGALPAPLKKTFETQVGATLGRDAVRNGVLIVVLGIGLVLVFMAIYYSWTGLIVDFAMILNVLYLLAILALFDARLTLPGIAGIVLTVGMAVDANVIINERIREELRAGRSPRAAVDAGYSRALWAVLDGQATTAIAGFVLAQYGSGPIRGFAVTLLIGILTSLFSSIVCTRLVFDWWIFKRRPTTLAIG